MTSKEKPNIVLILTDHWRGDCLGRLGHPAVETPHLDSLGRNGITFTEAYSPCPSCIAARRSIFSGQVPDTHGMLGFEDNRPWEFKHTLAGELTTAGYQTMNIGKTHFYPERLHLGFEQLIIPRDYEEEMERKTGHVRARFIEGVHGNSWMSRPNAWPETEMEETWLTNETMKKLLKRDPTRPFFSCLSFNGPHPPWTPPEYYFNLFMNKDLPDPVVGDWAEKNANVDYPMDVNEWKGKLSSELIHRAQAGFYAYLAYIDAQVGRLVEFLGRNGILNNTLFVFTADHGEMLGDHHLWRKTYAYDGSARIPFILSLPKSWEGQKNTQDDSLIGLEDVMPTLLEAAGLDIPGTVDGLSLLPVFREENNEQREYYHHEHSLCYNSDNAYQCLTDNNWKYIWNPITGEEQLFDRQNDFKEEHDLSEISKYLKELERWRLKLAKHLESRPEKFSDGRTLTPNPVPVWRDPNK